jgi:hypothetical protein
MKNKAISFQVGPGKRIIFNIAPSALKYIFGAFVIIFAKGDRILAILKTYIGW